jgi:hypothetical protein
MLLINYCLYICPLASPFISLIGLSSIRRRLRSSGFIPWTSRAAQNRIGPTGTAITRIHIQRRFYNFDIVPINNQFYILYLNLYSIESTN